jgi:hypothetical protein
MYKINELEFADLESAMAHARLLNQFVTIQGTDFEVCGLFGVDSIRDGMCPDGCVPMAWPTTGTKPAESAQHVEIVHKLQ